MPDIVDLGRLKRDLSGRCHACDADPAAARTECLGALATRGAIRANWDCWSACNLDCPFCFRSTAPPLETSGALRMLESLGHAGIQHLALTGGDPSLRRDLEIIVQAAHRLGMRVEILTNAQFQPDYVIRSLLAADLVGLSIDGSCTSSHDSFRGKPGNFARNMKLMDMLDREDRRYVVRTLVSAANADEIVSVARLISGRPGLHRWSLQQFTAIGSGYTNRALYEISDEDFGRRCREAREIFVGGAAGLSVLSDDDKVGLYFFIDPSGKVFARTREVSEGILPTVGDMLCDHLDDIAARLSFDPGKHARRYSDWID